MVKSTLPSDLSSRGGRARGSGRDVQGLEQVRRQVHEMGVYLETNLSDPYGEVLGVPYDTSDLRVQRVLLLAPSVSSRR